MSRYAKRHYIDVARILRAYYINGPTRETAESLMEDFARLFRLDNTRFDAERFGDASRTGKGLPR